MIGYKGFEEDLKCRGFQYEIGKTYEMDGAIKLCERGFHFCEKISDCFTYYPRLSARYAKIEALGDVIREDDGDSKCVTNKIRILEEIPRDEALKMTNSGNWNSGRCNSGNSNLGNWNSGDCNSGNHNVGSCNSGDCNSGHSNSGDWNSGLHNFGDLNSGDMNFGNRNSGNRNPGNRNSGSRNLGHYNSGNCNLGNYNSGDYNYGSHNSGDRNLGNWNSGDWNMSSFNNGCFMSVNNPVIMMFNKPTSWTIDDWRNSSARYIMSKCPTDYTDTIWVSSSEMTDEEREAHLDHKTTGGYLKTVRHEADRQAWWDSLSANDKQTVMSLPNFDPDVFYECTEIRVKEGEG